MAVEMNFPMQEVSKVTVVYSAQSRAFLMGDILKQM